MRCFRTIGLLVLCAPVLALAQQADSVYTLAHAYTSLDEQQAQPCALADGQSGLWVVYTGTRSPGQQPNVILQHLNAAGTPLLSADGWQLCPSRHTQAQPQVVADGQGGIFVLWEEQRDFLRGIYGIHLDAEAQLLWSPLGEYLAPAAEPGTRFSALSDKLGSLYLAWEDSRGAERIRQIYLQHLNTEGSPSWAFGGVPVAPVNRLQRHPRLDVSPEGGLLVLWEDYRSGSSWELYAQHYSPGGEPEWDRMGIALPPPGANQNLQRPVMQGDGFGGLLCAYEVLGPGTRGKDLYLARITRNGRLVYQLPICRERGNQAEPGLIVKGADLLVYWLDDRTTDTDLYAQRIDIQSGTAWWAADGTLVCLNGASQQAVRAGSGSVFTDQLLIWQDNRRGWPGIYAQKLNAKGTALWPYQGLAITEEKGDKHNLQVVSTESGGAWIVWQDYRNPVTPKLYANRILETGELLDTAGSVPLYQVVEHKEARILNPQLIAGQLQDFYLAWEDYRSGPRNPDVYAQRLDAYGTPYWTPNGLPICTAPSYQSLPKLCATATGLQLAWLDHRNRVDDDLYYQQITYNARGYRGLSGTPMVQAFRSQSDLSQLLDTDGNLWLAWTDGRSFLERGFQVYLNRIDPSGTPLLGTQGRAVAPSHSYQTGPCLSKDPRDNLYLAWMDERSGVYNIRMHRYDRSGRPLWSEEGLAISPTPAHQRYPALQCPEEGGVVAVWADDRFGQDYTKIFAQRMASNGKPLWGEAGRPVCPHAGRQTHPELYNAQNDEMLVVWLDQRSQAQTDYLLMAQKLNGRGEPVWEERGLPIGSFLHENYPFSVVVQWPMVLYAWQAKVGTQGNEQVFYRFQDLRTGQLGAALPAYAAAPGTDQLQPVVAAQNGQYALCWVQKDKQTDRHELKLRFVLPYLDTR
ncbi:MAG: hypothetical protein ACK5QE_01495 [Sphingobacteriia bacterium]